MFLLKWICQARNAKEQEERILPKLTICFSKTTTDTISTYTSTSILRASIAIEREERSMYVEPCDTEVRALRTLHLMVLQVQILRCGLLQTETKQICWVEMAPSVCQNKFYHISPSIHSRR
jgi:hypothetical protein